MNRNLFFTLLLLGLVGCSNQEAKQQVQADQQQAALRTQFDERKAQNAEVDQPHFDFPAVDYTLPVTKVDLNNDKQIIAAVGKPVVEKESGANQNGEPMTTYYFSDDLRNGLEISLSREFVDVAWKFNAKDKAKSDAAFNDGQRITRALLGGEIGVALYTSIIKGSDIDAISFKDGTEVNHARCGEYMCRYQVVR